jgi:hypothetical protein
MKRFLLVTALLISLTGCAYFTERGQAMAACGGDAKCIETVANAGKAGKAVGDATGIPWAGAAAGGLSAFLVLFFARKKKEETK